jgi:hypothetical protein
VDEAPNAGLIAIDHPEAPAVCLLSLMIYGKSEVRCPDHIHSDIEGYRVKTATAATFVVRICSAHVKIDQLVSAYSLASGSTET